MKTISPFKFFGLIVFMLFASCQDNQDDDTPNNDDDDLSEVSCEISFTDTLIENNSENIASYTFEANALESDSDVVYSWVIDRVQSQEITNVINHTFTENGTYEVCVFAETPECPDGTEFCTEIIVDSILEIHETCPDITFNSTFQNSVYNFTASSNIEIGSRYVWSVNDELINNDTTIEDSNLFTYDFPQNGSYKVCVSVETPNCPNSITYCETIEVTNAGDGAISVFNITVTEPIQNSTSETCSDLTYDFEGNIFNVFTFNINNPNADYVYSWSVNGVSIEGSEIANYEFVDIGTYTICVSLETPDCPNGVSYCRDFIVEQVALN